MTVKGEQTMGQETRYITRQIRSHGEACFPYEVWRVDVTGERVVRLRTSPRWRVTVDVNRVAKGRKRSTRRVRGL